MEITEKQKFDFYDSMLELSQLYEKVKKIILLTEYESSEKATIPVASMIEIRNSFDHIMRYFANPNSGNQELSEARNHLYRAAFSSYEMLITSKMNFLASIKKDFSIEDIEKIYPQYFISVLPLVEETKILLVQSRNKKDLFLNRDLFDKYEGLLNSINKETEALIKLFPSLNELSIKNRSRRYKNLIINIIIGILSALASGISLYFILNK